MQYTQTITSIFRRSVTMYPAAHQSIQLNMKREDHFKRIDRVPRESELIYKHPLHYSLNSAKLLSTASMGFVATTIAYDQLLKTKTLWLESKIWLEHAIEITDFYPMLLGLFVINSAILICVRAIPMRIYQLQTEYVAIFPGILPFYNQKFYFKKGELVENPMFSSDVFFKLRSQNIILYEHRFRKPSDLYSLLPASQSMKYTK